MVRVSQSIAAVLLATCLCGCEWVRSQWPWAKRDVPVTPPRTMAPATQASQPVAAPSPIVLAPPLTQPAETRPAETQPSPAATRSVERPTPLTELTPTTAAIAVAPRVETGRVLSETKLVAASILQVNERFITVEDVLRGLGPKFAELPKNISEESFREQAERILREEIRRQVTESLVFAEAQKRLTDEQKKEVDREMDEVQRDLIAGAGGSRKKLEQDLAKEDTTLDAVLQQHRQRITNTVYLRSKFMPTVVVNRRMLLDYYRRNPSEFTAAKKVQMQLIAAPFKSFLAEGPLEPTAAELGAARAKAKEHIEAAAAALKDANDFSKVVKAFSRGPAPDEEGLWPLMPAGSFREVKVEQAAFALAEGGVSGVVQTDSGFYVVRAKKVDPGRTVSFEEAQETIEKRIRDEQYRKITDEYFKRLFAEGATIIETNRFIELALARAVERYHRK